MNEKQKLLEAIASLEVEIDRLQADIAAAIEVFKPRQLALSTRRKELHKQFHAMKLAEPRELIVSALHARLTCNPSIKRGTVWLYIDHSWYDHEKLDQIRATVLATSAVEAVRKVLPNIREKFPEARYFLVESGNDYQLPEDEVIVDTSDWSTRPSDSEYTGGGIP